MIQAKGYLGNSVSFDGEWVTIHRRGLNALLLGGREIRMHVSTISHVRFRGADLQQNGFVEFVYTQRRDRKARRSERKQQVLNPKQSVYFLRRHQSSFEDLHAAVSQAVHLGPGSPQQHGSGLSLPEQIGQLQELLRQGALTQEQYDQAVAKLTA